MLGVGMGCGVVAVSVCKRSFAGGVKLSKGKMTGGSGKKVQEQRSKLKGRAKEQTKAAYLDDFCIGEFDSKCFNRTNQMLISNYKGKPR